MKLEVIDNATGSLLTIDRLVISYDDSEQHRPWPETEQATATGEDPADTRLQFDESPANSARSIEEVFDMLADMQTVDPSKNLIIEGLHAFSLTPEEADKIDFSITDPRAILTLRYSVEKDDATVWHEDNELKDWIVPDITLERLREQLRRANLIEGVA